MEFPFSPRLKFEKKTNWATTKISPRQTDEIFLSAKLNPREN